MANFQDAKEVVLNSEKTMMNTGSSSGLSGNYQL